MPSLAIRASRARPAPWPRKRPTFGARSVPSMSVSGTQLAPSSDSMVRPLLAMRATPPKARQPPSARSRPARPARWRGHGGRQPPALLAGERIGMAVPGDALLHGPVTGVREENEIAAVDVAHDRLSRVWNDGTRFGPVSVGARWRSGGGGGAAVATLTPCNAGTCQGFSGTDVSVSRRSRSVRRGHLIGRQHARLPARPASAIRPPRQYGRSASRHRPARPGQGQR